MAGISLGMSAWIRGKAAPFEAAVQEAASLLGSARAPLIAGLAAEVEALRAVFSLGATIGAALDPVAAPSLYADLAALAGAGAVSTTPTELLQRADLVVAVGARAESSSIVQVARSTEPTVGSASGPRRVMTLDGSNAPQGLAIHVALLRALATGRQNVEHPARDMASALRAARFGVAVYDPLELGELGVEMLHGLAAELNETTRFFTLSLADPWQGRTVLQVGAWMTGGGPRVGFGRGFPEHDPWRFDAERMVQAGEVDAVLWLASCDAPRPHWLDGPLCVSISDGADESCGAVSFAVARPGKTGSGVIWDERRGTLAFAEARTAAAVPAAAAIVRAIERAVAPEREARC
jgi:formylmethanofuran dehydrogenase subunit B